MNEPVRECDDRKSKTNLHSKSSYSDFLVHSERVGIEDEISVMETSSGESQS